jgi:hypothetical protein
MFPLLIKRYSLFAIIFLSFCNLVAADEKQESDIKNSCEMQDQAEVSNAPIKPWYRKGMFWFGLINGLSLPLPYAVVLGFNLVDISHPAVKEKLKPFAHGACVGIALWFVDAIFSIKPRSKLVVEVNL